MGRKRLMKFEREANETEIMSHDDTVHQILVHQNSDSQKWNDSEHQVSDIRQDIANIKYKENFDDSVALTQEIEKMTAKELSERVFHCIRLCVENKINIKNAFNLHLVDWLFHLLKHKNNLTNNFSTLACTLDASTQIYSHRVDIIHKEVLRFKHLIILSVQNKKVMLLNGEEKHQTVKMCQSSNKLKKKKTVLKNSMTLHRKNVKSPLYKFIKVEDHPGDLIEAILKTGKTLSSEAPFRPVCKNSYLQGKLIPLSENHCEQQFCYLSRICGHLLGNSTKMEEKVIAIKDNQCEEDFDPNNTHGTIDPFFNDLLTDQDESATNKKQEDIVDVMAEKVMHSMLVNTSKPFDKLSRIEKLNLFLLPKGNVLVNPDLDDLVYGPLHAKYVKKNPRKVRRKPVNTQKSKSVVFLNFEADFGSKTVESDCQLKPNRKMITTKLKRKTLMPKTVNNWNEVKVMGPEEIIINRSFLHMLNIKDDIHIEDKYDEFVEECLDYELNNINKKTNYQLIHPYSDTEEPSTWPNKTDCSEDSKLIENQMVIIKGHKLALLEGETKENAVGVCNHIEEPVVLQNLTCKLQNLTCSTVNRHVNMKRLKDTIKNIMDITNKVSGHIENTGKEREQESGNNLQSVSFSDLYLQVLNRLDDCSANNLTPQMTFMGLLHVMSENEHLTVNCDNDTTDLLIMKKGKNSDSNPEEIVAISQGTSDI